MALDNKDNGNRPATYFPAYKKCCNENGEILDFLIHLDLMTIMWSELDQATDKSRWEKRDISAANDRTAGLPQGGKRSKQRRKNSEKQQCKAKIDNNRNDLTIAKLKSATIEIAAPQTREGKKGGPSYQARWQYLPRWNYWITADFSWRRFANFWTRYIYMCTGSRDLHEALN